LPAEPEFLAPIAIGQVPAWLFLRIYEVFSARKPARTLLCLNAAKLNPPGTVKEGVSLVQHQETASMAAASLVNLLVWCQNGQP
jgi:hypothetical protein